MHRFVRSFSFAFAVSAALLVSAAWNPSPASAASVSSGYSISGPAPNCVAGAAIQVPGQLFFGQITAPECDSPSGYTGNFSSFASAETTYGTLRATSQVTYEDLARGTSAGLGTATGISRYEDSIVLDAPGRTGEVVDLIFETAIEGETLASISGTGPSLVASATGLLRVRVNGSGYYSAALGVDNAGNVTSFNFTPGVVSITLGTPFDVWAELRAETRLDDVGVGSLSGVNGEALAAFGNSGGFTSFELVDALAQPITDYTLSSESGAFHFYVPEPGSGLLIGLALTALLSARGRSRGARRPLRLRSLEWVRVRLRAESSAAWRRGRWLRSSRPSLCSGSEP